MNSPSENELHAVLGVSPGADAATLRAAYLRKIREHPPERDAEMFERVRDAYQTLSDPKRAMRRFFAPDALQSPLRDLLPDADACEGRAFLGPDPWRELLRHLDKRQKGGRA